VNCYWVATAGVFGAGLIVVGVVTAVVLIRMKRSRADMKHITGGARQWWGK
jgi:hypothetical protein